MRRAMATVHVLRPKPGKTLESSYSGIAYLNTNGNAECVEFIRQALGAPHTSLWREGKKLVSGDFSVLAGTPIATFVNGKYPQAGDTGKHAAIYLWQNSEGIVVLDQFRVQGEVKRRTIKWMPNKPGASNDAKSFAVVEW